jgi:hypothetical protein
MVIFNAFDSRGTVTGQSQVHGDAIFAPDPNGGAFAVGHLTTATDSPPPTDRVAFMFNPNGSIRYGPSTISTGSRGIFGTGVDLLGRAIIIYDGGGGAVDAQWVDTNGMAQPPFTLIAQFQAGVNTWFETSPLIGGGLAVRRMDATTNTTGPEAERRTSAWLLVLASGSRSPQAAPGWLRNRPNTGAELARGGRAYAMMPWSTDASPCAQQVELVSPSGNSCGTTTFTVDGSSCLTRELRLGLDGTVMQMLPASREQFVPGSSVVKTCTLRFWPAALH